MPRDEVEGYNAKREDKVKVDADSVGTQAGAPTESVSVSPICVERGIGELEARAHPPDSAAAIPQHCSVAELVQDARHEHKRELDE